MVLSPSINVFQGGGGLPGYKGVKWCSLDLYIAILSMRGLGAWSPRIILCFIRRHWMGVMTKSVEENNWLINLMKLQKI